MNASTSGISSRSSFAKRCDMQPLTISFWSGLLVRPRCWCAWRIALIDSSLAESMKAHVLTTRTSASSARDVISIPRCRTLPSMISASTRFLAQPRLIMPTFGLPAKPIAFLLIFISDVEKHPASNAAAKPSMFGVGCCAFPLLYLIDRYVFVILFERLTIFHDLNGVALENANRDMFAAKFYCPVGWRNPAFESGTFALIVYCDLKVGPFKRTNHDAIRRT